MSRIGGILAPQNQKLFTISKHLPFTVNGSLTLVACLLILLLKDTSDAPLEDYIDEKNGKILERY